MDPYDALGVGFGASDAEITRAYRKLALKLHPDKQGPGLSEKKREEIAKQFHDIKEARTFLLDAEHAEDRRQYDARRESERMRREANAARELNMSHRRKRMRDELKEKEAQARQQSRKQQQTEKAEKDVVDQLRKEGQQRREEQARRDTEKELEREFWKQRQERKITLEERQVRLKWDRKKMKISPSVDSIASLLSQFGAVESVEFLGKKGNQALVTFQDASSCRPCVDAYATNKEMRAKFVGQRKDQEGDEEEEDHNDPQPKQPESSRMSATRDTETLERRRLRQAAEREALLWQMREEGDEMDGTTERVRREDLHDKPKKSRSKTTARTVPFPLPFPETDALRDLPPYQKLEVLEKQILGGLLTPEQVESLRIKTA